MAKDDICSIQDALRYLLGILMTKSAMKFTILLAVKLQRGVRKCVTS